MIQDLAALAELEARKPRASGDDPTMTAINASGSM